MSVTPGAFVEVDWVGSSTVIPCVLTWNGPSDSLDLFDFDHGLEEVSVFDNLMDSDEVLSRKICRRVLHVEGSAVREEEESMQSGSR